jgi:PEP-CTERM motif
MVSGAKSTISISEITSMTHRLVVAVLLISVSGLLAPPASAEITSVSAAGPGGTVSSLAIETTFMTDDSVQFDANYTSPARIVLTLTVDGSGNYFIGAPFGDITNGTGASFPSFFAFLVGAPAGVTFDEASWEDAVFSNGANFIPPTSEVAFNGPPGLGAGDSTEIGVGFSVPSSGPETFEVVLTPTAAAVPEPSTWAMMLLGFAGLGYLGYRSSRKSVALAV